MCITMYKEPEDNVPDKEVQIVCDGQIIQLAENEPSKVGHYWAYFYVGDKWYLFNPFQLKNKLVPRGSCKRPKGRPVHIMYIKM